VQQRDEHEQASEAVQEQPPVVGQAQDLPDMRQGDQNQAMTGVSGRGRGTGVTGRAPRWCAPRSSSPYRGWAGCSRRCADGGLLHPLMPLMAAWVTVRAVRATLAIASLGDSPHRSVRTNSASALTMIAKSCLS